MNIPIRSIPVLPVLLILALQAAPAPAQSPSEIQAWLDAHNRYRALHGVPPVSWSPAAAASAQAWADTCPASHSGSAYGENIAFATYAMSPGDVVALWYSEEPDYDYNNPGFSPETGHFTQVVWKSTTEIGCGYRSGCPPPAWPHIWVCQYNPPGNYLGQFAANVFPPTPLPPPPPGGEPGGARGAILPAILQILLR